MNLSIHQQKIVEHTTGPALVLAVPGAGKTTVLIYRILYLIQQCHIDPKSILSITFSRVQARDMERRFHLLAAQKAPGLSSTDVTFSTIHAFAYDILRTSYALKRRKVELIEGSDRYNKIHLIKSLYHEIHQRYISDDSLDEFFRIHSFIKNSQCSLEEYLKENQTQLRSLDVLYQRYEDYKKEHHLIDFDDMLTDAYDVIQNEPAILKRVKKKYRYFQMDEAQDSSSIQLELMRKIVAPEDNLFVVADDDQSIYSFRGANPQELLSFHEYYPDAKIYFMEENYRSYKDIVLASNRFIKTNALRYDKNITTSKAKLSPIKMVKSRNMEASCQYITDHIKNIQEQDPTKTIAILYRNNRSSLPLIYQLTESNIPFHLREQKQKVLGSFIIKDILEILRFAEDRSRLDLFVQLYYKFPLYLKKEIVGSLSYIPGDNVLDRLLQLRHLSHYQYDNINDLNTGLDLAMNVSLSKAIGLIEDEIGYRKYLKNRIGTTGGSVENAKMILETLKFIAKSCSSIDELEDKIKALFEPQKNPNDNLTLSTIHSSKGLEFNIVFLIDLIEGEFPSHQIHDLEEERRLFYVGMTRAKEQLYLITLKTRNGEPVIPSTFYKEVRALKKAGN